MLTENRVAEKSSVSFVIITIDLNSNIDYCGVLKELKKMLEGSDG